MINCESCNDWFHGACISLEESDEQLIDTYICPLCTSSGKGQTSWVRKCRLDGCKKPAVQAVRTKGKTTRGSKYCCHAHGIEFYNTKLQSLEVEGLTRSQIKALLEAVAGADEFKGLGDEEPPVPEEVLMKFKTTEDDSRLADLRLEREKISRKLEIVKLRSQFLQIAIEKAKQINLDLKNSLPTPTSTGKNKSKPKIKELCAFDTRVLFEDSEFLEWTASEESKKIFAEGKIEGDTGCEVEKRRCRHAGWQGLRAEEILMEEGSLRGKLDEIVEQEKIITYLSRGVC
jgi:COMPASS component SPP1